MLSKETKQTLILNLLGLDDKKENIKSNQIAQNLIGKICIFRTYSAGVHFGILIERDGKECLVKNARRIFHWVKACTLSQLAMEGSKDYSGCKITMQVDEIFLSEVIEIIPMPKQTVNEMYGCPEWKS